MVNPGFSAEFAFGAGECAAAMGPCPGGPTSPVCIVVLAKYFHIFLFLLASLHVFITDKYCMNDHYGE